MKTIVYGKTEQDAKRRRRPKAGETVTYKSILDHDEEFNQQFDEVELLCAKPKRKSKGD